MALLQLVSITFLLSQSLAAIAQKTDEAKQRQLLVQEIIRLANFDYLPLKFSPLDTKAQYVSPFSTYKVNKNDYALAKSSTLKELISKIRDAKVSVLVVNAAKDPDFNLKAELHLVPIAKRILDEENEARRKQGKGGFAVAAYMAAKDAKNNGLPAHDVMVIDLKHDDDPNEVLPSVRHEYLPHLFQKGMKELPSTIHNTIADYLDARDAEISELRNQLNPLLKTKKSSPETMALFNQYNAKRADALYWATRLHLSNTFSEWDVIYVILWANQDYPNPDSYLKQQIEYMEVMRQELLEWLEGAEMREHVQQVIDYRDVWSVETLKANVRLLQQVHQGIISTDRAVALMNQPQFTEARKLLFEKEKNQ